MTSDRSAPLPTTAIVRIWWRRHQPRLADGTRNPDADRAAMARLRRAGVADALADPAVLDLYRRLGLGASDRALAERLPWVAAVATVLAHVREDAPADGAGRRTHPARAAGRKHFDDPPETAIVKPMRFRRLLTARAVEEVERQMRRLVAVLPPGAIDVGALGRSILDWPDPGRGDRTRTRWAFEYHAAGEATPRDAQSTLPDEPALPNEPDAPNAEATP
ncbi:type I-E CRISPR-associated protein Cse2/CasB [Stella sp.]|uniref:type I-E CRISPR-associated protein Cse2/CasB n=1 Tax=Stella sp. TaxID=2912054 RepID=UPI0035B32AA8